MHCLNACDKLDSHLLWVGLAQGGRREDMKQNIHPTLEKVTVTCSACGNEFESLSTRKEIKVDTCSNCHPFFTGKQRFAQAQGRVEKFNKKYGIK